jgi:hypothetical protein
LILFVSTIKKYTNLKMNLPIRALYEIQAFSKPVTRVDWRTCKNAEVRIIRQHNRAKLEQYERDLLIALRMPLRLVVVDEWPLAPRGEQYERDLLIALRMPLRLVAVDEWPLAPRGGGGK